MTSATDLDPPAGAGSALNRGPARQRRRAPAASTYAGGLLLALFISSAGCANMAYKGLKLGAPPRDYDRALRAEQTRRTDLGLCSLDHDRLSGRTDAIVVLWTTDRRIYAKFQATYREAEFGITRRGDYSMRGEFLPQMADLEGASLPDMLRALIVEMNAFRGERGAVETYGWVVSGLARIVEQQAGEAAVAEGEGAAANFLDRVPPGGTAVLERQGNRVSLSYSVGAKVR